MQVSKISLAIALALTIGGTAQAAVVGLDDVSFESYTSGALIGSAGAWSSEGTLTTAQGPASAYDGQRFASLGLGDRLVQSFSVDTAVDVAETEEGRKDCWAANVHAVGASSLAAGHLTLVPELRAALKKLGREDIMIVVGGVIPPADVEPLLEMGAAAVYPPGSVIADTAVDLLDKLNQRLGYAQPKAG